MENNNGKGIFYGVIGVATLVVAIIGATFAFFAASANGTNNAVAANSVSLAGTLTLTDSADARTQLIPATEAIMKQSYVQTGTKGQADGKCNGVSAADANAVYDLCSTYTFTLGNKASVSQLIYVNLTTTANSFENLYYCIFEGEGTSKAARTCKAVPATTEQAFTVTLDPGTTEQPTTKSYTLVLYINETTQDQTTADSGKAYTGTITATTSGGENKVTGAIAGTSQPDA